jgi:hypothetical protein
MSLRHTLRVVALALASAGAVPAFAAVEGGGTIACADSFMSVTNEGFYVDCRGPLSGDVATLGSVRFTDVGELPFVGLTGDASAAFSGDPATGDFGLLQLGHVRRGNFVIGLQGVGNYSLYLFNGGDAGIGSINYDTFGILDGAGSTGPNLVRAALFASAVPEPAPAALLLIGLAALGGFARLRALQAHGADAAGA